MQYATNSNKKREKWRASSRRLVRRHPEASPQGNAAGRAARAPPPWGRATGRASELSTSTSARLRELHCPVPPWRRVWKPRMKMEK